MGTAVLCVILVKMSSRSELTVKIFLCLPPVGQERLKLDNLLNKVEIKRNASHAGESSQHAPEKQGCQGQLPMRIKERSFCTTGPLWGLSQEDQEQGLLAYDQKVT